MGLRNRPGLRVAHLAALVAVAVGLILVGGSRAQAPVRVYLPAVVAGGGCAPTAEEARAAELMLDAPEQARPQMQCHPTLERVARAKALDMATRGYFAHVEPDGTGPNYRVWQAGYRLPAWWDVPNNRGTNYIESLSAGNATADATMAGLLSDDAHRQHLLGLTAFWREQTNYGVGYAANPNSPFRHYWVILTAPPEAP